MTILKSRKTDPVQDIIDQLAGMSLTRAEEKQLISAVKMRCREPLPYVELFRIDGNATFEKLATAYMAELASACITGEQREEVILPLKRDENGKLGVAAPDFGKTVRDYVETKWTAISQRDEDSN